MEGGVRQEGEPMSGGMDNDNRNDIQSAKPIPLVRSPKIMIEWRDRVDGSFAWCGHYRLDIAPNGSEFDASVVEARGGQTLPRLNSPNLRSLDVAKSEASRLARLIIDADIKQLEELRSRLPCEPLTMAPGRIFV